MFKNLPILHKLLLTFGGVVAICGVSCLILVSKLMSVLRILSETADGNTLAAHREVLISGIESSIWLVGLPLSQGFIGVFISSFFIKRLVVRPIERARDAAARIAKGDLTEDLQSHWKDETGALLAALTTMQCSLRASLQQVQSASGSITTAACEVSSGAGDLSVRTETTAASLQKSSATMQSLANVVDSNGQSASQASTLAASASAAVSEGGAAVQRVIASMTDIHVTSKKISDIIGVIDGIAFQTNILALNAAVEAARAGEQGRGFAVVASEVRSLSHRSSNAAKEIRSLIMGSVTQVETGSKQVAEAGQSMNGIMQTVTQLASLVDSIANSSQAQAHDINEVALAVQNVDSMTQQNAVLVEQSAAAAESLKDQAASLSRVVAAFRVSA